MAINSVLHLKGPLQQFLSQVNDKEKNSYPLRSFLTLNRLRGCLILERLTEYKDVHRMLS